jgi:hypothetical protein
MHAKVNNHAES